MQVESMRLADLVLDPSNARRHAPKNLEAIKGSLAKFGQQKPIVIGKGNVVIAGNGTLEAARSLGWDAINVVRTKLEGPDATAFAIADNRTGELAEWDAGVLSETLKALDAIDFDLGAIGFDADDLAGMIATPAPPEGLTDPDAVPENVETRCKPGDLWVLGEHRLLCGDSTNPQHVSRLLNSEAPVLMVTDPPYGVEYDPNWRNDAAEKGLISYAARSVGKVQNDDRVDWAAAWALYGAQVGYVWHDAKKAAEVQKSLEDCDYQVIAQIVWAKPRFAISRGDYHWQHESCWYVHKKGETHNWQGSRSESTLWSIESGCAEKTGHGTEKPVECMARPVRNNSANGDLVCDPFLGSGSTLIACEKTGRRCFGMEIDPKYCDVILTRWEQFTGNTAELSA